MDKERLDQMPVDPFYSEKNMSQLEKAAEQTATGKVIVKTMEELEAMERE